MNNKLKIVIHRNRKLLVAVGLTTILGGVASAYFTGDAEPWGTIGGFFSAIGLMLALIAGFSKED